MHKHVFANPRPWPLAGKNASFTSSVAWQRCCASVLETPYVGNLSALTGVMTTADEQGVVSPPSGMPWAAVQFSSDGVWGAAINTSGTNASKEPLTTSTLESAFGDEGCAPVFGQGGQGGFQVELEMAVPTAFHEPRAPGLPAAVYVSLSIYLQTIRPPRRFVWYSTNLFDLERDVVTDHVFIDTSSKKLIVSGPLSGVSSYNRRLPDSALARNTTFGPQRLRFAYAVDAGHVEQGIRDGLARFPDALDLPTRADAYCVPGYNIELEGTKGAGAGIAVWGLNITAM